MLTATDKLELFRSCVSHSLCTLISEHAVDDAVKILEYVYIELFNEVFACHLKTTLCPIKTGKILYPCH